SGIKVVYTDLDGTMLGLNGSFLHDPDGAATLEPAEALLAARAASIDVVPASGRALRGLQTDARLIGLPTVIAEMGAQISYDFGWVTLHDNGRLHGEYLGIPKGAARAYHLQPRGVSKGLAVAIDRERRDFSREHAVAIGDAFADLELASEVGVFVIVRDALVG